MPSLPDRACRFALSGVGALMPVLLMLVTLDLTALAQDAPLPDDPNWIPAVGGQVPQGAVRGGQEAPPGNGPLYVCRAAFMNGIHPGKIGTEFGGCNIAWDGKERAVRRYQVLSGTYRWQAAHDGEIPAGALKAGEEQPPGRESLFVCRALFAGGIHPGKLRPAFQACNIPWGGGEHAVRSYEVLVKLTTTSGTSGSANQPLPSGKRGVVPGDLTFTFSGSNAPVLAAAAIATLAKQHPALILGSDPNAHVYVPSVANSGGSSFWDTMINAGAWARGVPQPDFLPGQLATTIGGKSGYFIPQLITRLEIDSEVVVLDLPSTSNELSEKQTRSLCREHRWSDATPNDNCVISLIPSELTNPYAERSNLAVKREVIVKKPALKLIVHGVPQKDRDSVLDTVSQATQDIAKEKQLKSGSLNKVTPQEAKSARGLIASAANCDANRLRQATTQALSVIRWPFGSGREPRNTPLVTLDESGALEETNVSNIHLPIKDTSALPDTLKAKLLHPVWNGGALAISCNSIPAKVQRGQLDHSVAISSIAIGHKIAISDVPGATVAYTGFYESGNLTISRKDKLYPDAMVPASTPQVVLAAYQEAAPTPVQPNNQDRFWKPRARPYPSDYARQVYRYIGGNSLIVTGAPVLEDPAIGPTAGDYDENAAEPCKAWPACLGATGHVLTVAAFDNSGNVVTEEPGTQKAYDLSEKFVSVGAPGQEVLMATTSGKTYSFELAGGTSVAAAVVAALAMELQEHVKTAYQVLATIEATADLAPNQDGRIRFGLVNARRASHAIALPSGGAMKWKLDEADTGTLSQGVVMQVRGLRDVHCDDYKLSGAEDGVLVYYTADSGADSDELPVNCIPVNWLLRLRRTG